MKRSDANMLNIPGYQIIKQIYESANSSVYRAVRIKDNLAVIFKVLKENYPSPEELSRYRQEFDITRRLADSEGVIKAYRLEKHQNTLVMHLEDFGGESLKIWLDEQRNFTLDELFTFAIRITEILGLIHEHNIIHKDINPSNIILNPASGVLKIIDFGISTQLSKQHLTLKNPVVLEGTLAYMSPEQTGRMNRALDYRTDFYSLGATFYELFTGVTPFDTTDAMESVHCHIAKQPTPPCELRNRVFSKNPVSVQDMISDIIMKLLEKTAEARYQSAWGLKADLQECKLQFAKTGLISHFSLAQKDISDRFQIPQKLYGREPETATLLSAFERIAAGKTEIMLVAGYSGVGKSVLVKEIYKSLTEKQGYFISGKFDQFQRNIPYSAGVSAFQELVRQLLTENEEQLSVWKEKLLTALGPNGHVIIDVLPEIELIIGTQPPVPQLGPAESQNRFNSVFQNFMQVFCQPEHPLIFFLDDLQWVDSATLKLIELVATDKETTALFFIGAYRDNEADPTHPLMTTLDKLREERVTINQITLKPLAFKHIKQLIADSLHHNLEAVVSLTDLVMRKTGGNPFFVNLFLQTLYEDNLLYFVNPTPEQNGYWQWDIRQYKTLRITDNVADLMIGKLKKMPESAQHVLRLAACVGNRFDLDTLSVIYEKSAIATFPNLMPVLAEGLIIPLSEPEMNGSDIHKSQFIIHHFQFLHDRVQQAAYALIDEKHKRAVHLQIGRQLLLNTPAGELEGKLFDIVGHFNHSIESLHSQAERLKVAQLNLMAGQKAKMATAYGAAIRYLTIGRKCLTENSWESEYDLTLCLFTEAVETAYLSGDFEHKEQLAQTVLQHARTLSDEMKVCEIQISAYTAQHQQPKAIKIALSFLNRLGINFPEEPTQEDVGLALQKIQVSLSGKPIRSLIDLPMMTDTEKILTMRLMVAVTHSAFFASPNLMVLLILKQVDLSLAYGNIAESGFSYVCYGWLLCSMVGDIESGYQFGQLALDLLQRFREKRLKANVIHVFNIHVRLWKEHVRETLPSLLENYKTGLETGKIEYAAYSIRSYTIFSYFIGKELVTLEQEMALYNHTVARLKQEGILSWHNVFWQVVLNLTKHSGNPCRLDGEVYDENIQLPLHLKMNDRLALLFLYLNKCILHFQFLEYAPAVKNAEIAEQYLDGATGGIALAIFHFYDSLTRLAVYPSLPQREQDTVLTKVAANQDKMWKWAHHAPMNYLHKFYLVEAERARVSGKGGDAREFYDKAIALAYENKYLNEVALAYELAGQFYQAKGQTKFAQVCLFDAHYAYQQWGATAKVKNLEARYPQFLAPKTTRAILTNATASTRRITSTSTTGSSERLDLSSIMKAAQTLSGEIVLSRLLEKMMHIVIENAGAEKGFLLLPKKGSWFIEAEGHIDSSDTTVLQSLPLEESEQVSANIIHYVARTQENLVLHDATQKGRFTRDAYIVKHRPKSVLCVPLVNLRQLTGILYLENSLTTGAFTPARLEVLNLLSSQIAISIENSILYNNLEQKVAERTSELELEIIIRKKSEEAAKVANQTKSTFLANMSHELRTPLNTILGFSQLTARSPDLAPEHLEHLGIITRSGEHLLALINQVLDLSKIEAGRTTLNDNNFNLFHLLDELENMFRLQAKEKHLLLRFDRTPDTPQYVRTDEVKLRQVFINLLNNAIKFTQAGEIQLRIMNCELRNEPFPHPSRERKSEIQYLKFEIEDTGPGIAADELDSLFEAFVQTESGKQSLEGTGLGLPISSKFVQLMGGDITVSSEVGRGTVFTFDIQCELADSMDKHQSKVFNRVVALEPNQPRYRILIVDDKQDNRQLLIKLLNPLGFEIREANNGLKAIKIWEEWEPHLICMDMLMPVMDGYEAAKRIKNEKGEVKTVIIAITASAFEEERTVVLSSGCDDFVRKPFREEDIYGMMRKHLGVRFVYELSSKAAGSEQRAKEAFKPEALTTLPSEVLIQLEQASIQGDSATIERVIEDIRAYDAALADGLAVLADEFEYGKVLELLRKYNTG